MLTLDEAYENNIITGWQDFVLGSPPDNASSKFRLAGTGSGSVRTRVPEDNLPQECNIYIRIDTTNATTLDHCICQNSVPLTTGETYTIGCWARGKGVLRICPTQSNYVRVYNQSIDTQGKWRFFAGTFTAASTSQNIYWANDTDSSSNSVLDICAPLLVAGGVQMSVIARDQVTVVDYTDVDHIVTWYKLTSSLTPPTKPTGTAPSGWTTTEPAYTSGSTQYLWTCQQNVFGDGSVWWGEVSQSSSFEAAKEAWNKADAAASAAENISSEMPELIIGTQTAATRLWTGVSTKLDTLTDGAQIIYWLPYATKAEDISSVLPNAADKSKDYSNDYLRLQLKNGSYTDWIPCYYGSTTRITSHYGAGSAIRLIYRSNAIIAGTARGAGWWADANYDSGNTTANYYANTVLVGSNTVFKYTLMMENADGTWSSIVTSSSTGTGKQVCTNGFKLANIVYNGNNANYTTGTGTGVIYGGSIIIDHRYSFNTVNNATNGLVYRKPVYLVGTIGSDGLYYLDTTKWWTQTLPTSEDGKVYVLIGVALGDYYHLTLSDTNPAYVYYEGEIVEYNDYLSREAAKTATNYMNFDNNGLVIGNMTDETLGRNVLIDSTSIKIRKDNTTTLANFDDDSVDFYNDSGTSVATFGGSTRIGLASGKHVTLDSNGMHFYNGSDEYFRAGTKTVIGYPGTLHLILQGGSLGFARGGSDDTSVSKMYYDEDEEIVTNGMILKIAHIYFGDQQTHIRGITTDTACQLFIKAGYKPGTQNLNKNTLIDIDATHYGTGTSEVQIHGTDVKLLASNIALNGNVTVNGIVSGITPGEVGAAAASHTHAASAINSGELSVARGGTGKASHTINSVLTGGTTTTGAVQDVATASGALYATTANGAPQFGTLPIAQGGTGKTTAADARTALGITPANIGALAKAGDTATGDIKLSKTGIGFYGVDSTGHAYPYARDNGSNLWIGATSTASQHHKGGTYISAGYNGSAGNPTIYVCVPNADNDNGTSYGVYHTGNKPSASDVGAVPAARTKSSATNQITMASGCTLVNIYTNKLGSSIVSLVVRFKFSAALTARSSHQVGTVIAGLRPYDTMNSCTNYYGDVVQVTSGGVINYWPNEAKAANTEIRASFTYVLS